MYTDICAPATHIIAVQASAGRTMVVVGIHLEIFEGGGVQVCGCR